MGTRSRAARIRTTSPASIAFDRTKYGAELLVDVAWIHEIPTFLLDCAHELRFHDLTLVTAGRGTLWLDGTALRVEPGVILCTSPGQVRRWVMRTPLDGICLFFPAEFLESYFNDALFLQRLPYFDSTAACASVDTGGSERRRLARLLTSMHRELRPLRRDSSHLLRARLYDVLVSVARLHANQYPVDRREPERTTARFRELVVARVREEHRVARYARDLAVSPNYLNALCRQHLGMTARQVISTRLAVEARRLLHFSVESVARIALALGFRDASHFSRFVRRHLGCSPRELRARARGGG